MAERLSVDVELRADKAATSPPAASAQRRRSTLAAGVSTELRKFLETTSIRGIPRILKSKTRVALVLWLVAVMICSALLAWQVALVFQRYARFSINTVVVQASDDHSPTFPDVTLCNLCSLVHETEMSLQYEDYARMLDRQMTFEKAKLALPGLDDSEVNQTMAYFYIPAAYLSNFPVPNKLLYNPDTSPIIEINPIDWTYNPYPINYSTQVSIIWDELYARCYKLSLNKNDLVSQFAQTAGFSTILYVDDFPFSLRTVPPLMPGSQMSSGLVVVLHEVGTAPDATLGFSVSPGTETTILFDATLRKRLPAPYSNCTTKAHLPEDFWAYDQDYCKSICCQQQLIDACGCFDIWHDVTEAQLEKVNHTACGNISLTSPDSRLDWSGVARLQCSKDFRPDFAQCSRGCPVRCTQYEYSTTVSATPYPSLAGQLAFYQKYIEGRPRYGDLFDGYKDLEGRALASNRSVRDMLTELDAEGGIGGRFLQLNVGFESRLYNELTDQAAFPLDALGAQIGGVLSLWLGLSVMVLVELLEFLYAVVSEHCVTRCSEQTAA